MKNSIILIMTLIILASCNYVPKNFNGKFEDALKLNAEYKCTGNSPNGVTLNALIKNTEFRVTAKTQDGNIIESVGDVTNCIYGWLPNSNTGEQVCLTKEEFEKGVNILEKSKDTGITVNCTKYKVEDSIFETPKNVNFFPPA